MSFRSALAATALMTLGACNTLSSPYRNIGMEDPNLGEAVRYNAAMHTINPDPVYAEDSAQPGDNGDRGAQAVKRYRTDQVMGRHNREARQGSVLSTTGGSNSGSSGPR